MTIYVGNLSYEVTKEDLESIFVEYGTLKKIYLPIDPEKERIKGFAFVDLATQAEETEAIATLDGASWLGRSLKVSQARPKQKRSSFGSGISYGF